MYILILDEGYLHIEKDEKGQYSIVEYEGEQAVECSLKVMSRKKAVRIMPFGQIVINQYNHELDKYIADGGTVSEVLRFHSNNKLKKLKEPYPPQWIILADKGQQSISDIDFENDPTYVSTSYVRFMGKLVPIFQVNRISDLYFYDLYRIQTADLIIKECIDCGHAFIARTTAIRCQKCRDAGFGERKKRMNRKSDPARSKAYKIVDRNCPNKRNPDITYNGYQGQLQNVIADSAEERSAKDHLDFLNLLDAMDKRFFNLCKYFSSDNCIADDETYNEWQTAKKQFPNVQDMKAWIETWEKRK
ncbi:MAG: hypothetical protein LUG93_19450 [Lachnospiraceae bacterium]|nr:hypothetical protein [Lachnospiraceae bacterium]